MARKYALFFLCVYIIEFYLSSRGMNGQYAAPSTDVLGPKHGVQKQHVSISSKDRIGGYPGQFVVNLLPTGMYHIMKIELLSFVGQLHPYNVLQNGVYIISQVVSTGGGHSTTTNYTITITPGDYSLDDILIALNMNPFVRFSYNTVTGKVIAERLTGVTGVLTANDVGTAVIGPLIGYPQGITWQTTDIAVQSVFAVSPHTSVSSIIIGFDEFAPGVVTTGNVSSGFTVPVNQFTYNSVTRQIHFNEESNYKQTIEMNRKTVSRLFVKIQNQATPGTPFRYVGECYMDLNVYYIGGSN